MNCVKINCSRGKGELSLKIGNEALKILLHDCKINKKISLFTVLAKKNIYIPSKSLVDYTTSYIFKVSSIFYCTIVIFIKKI